MAKYVFLYISKKCMDKLKVWFILGLFVFYLGFGMPFI